MKKISTRKKSNRRGDARFRERGRTPGPEGETKWRYNVKREQITPRRDGAKTRKSIITKREVAWDYPGGCVKPLTVIRTSRGKGWGGYRYHLQRVERPL